MVEEGLCPFPHLFISDTSTHRMSCIDGMREEGRERMK